MFYNYKQYFTIVLQAVMPAVNLFSLQWEYMGEERWGYFPELCNVRMEKHKLNIPAEEFLPNSDMKMPFVFTGDESYSLLKILLKHYAHKHVDEEK